MSIKNLKKIISGGQTGVDRAALDVALELKIPCGGWCPKGRKAEDGALDPIYPLRETPSEEYSQRTEWNVRDSDGVLILSYGTPTGGTALAIEFSRKHLKPHFIIDLKNKQDKRAFLQWLKKNNIQILSIGGSRESTKPGIIYLQSRAILKGLLSDDAPPLE